MVFPKLLRIMMLLIILLVAFFIYYGVTGGFSTQVDENRFNETITGMENMVEIVETGDIKEGEKAFNQVHGFFHDVDSMLIEQDPDLAKQLWDTVALIEAQFGSDQANAVDLINHGRKTIAILKEAREILR